MSPDRVPISRPRRRRRHHSKHRLRRKIKKIVYWVILPLIGSALLVKTFLFYFGTP